MSSVAGEKLKISLFGESHGPAVGCVIDGLPAGLALDTDAIQKEMARRAPHGQPGATTRCEADEPQILSGVQSGVTTGAPLAMVIANTDTDSKAYQQTAFVPRPSHGDYPAFVKCGGFNDSRGGGFNDSRGGGHGSGRLTAPLVFAGAIAKQALAQMGITVGAHILQIGAVCDTHFDFNHITKEQLQQLTENAFPVLTAEKETAMRAEIEHYRAGQDSVGGAIECAAVGLPVGAGNPFFDTAESRLSALLFAVPGVKGVQFGLGFDFAAAHAQAVNDGYAVQDGKVTLLSNHNGGVLGGMTSGVPLVLSVAVKPTPSIAAPQPSVNLQTMQNETLVIQGRHDACIVPRAVPVIEAAVAIGLLDMLL